MAGRLTLPNGSPGANSPVNTRTIFNDAINGMSSIDDNGVITVLGVNGSNVATAQAAAFLSRAMEVALTPTQRAAGATVAANIGVQTAAGAGIIRATATPLTSLEVYCPVAATGSGLLLPPATGTGNLVHIFGFGLAADFPIVYASGADTIDGFAGATGEQVIATGSGDAYILQDSGAGTWVTNTTDC